jgi:uncharacterized RDD family membrane protein YckC
MNAPLIRRLMSAFYDSLFVIAILFIITALALAANGGEAISAEHPLYWFYVLILVAISFTYYAWFLMHGGQTPGMKTWRMRLCRSDGLELKAVVLYLLAAVVSWCMLGIGYLWVVFDAQNRTWHDILLGCEMQDLRESNHA